MPLVTFTVTRNASYSNYIDFTSQTGSQPFTMGPDAGTVQLDLPEGTTYTLSGRSDQSSTVSWTQLGNQVVGLEDGADSDYDDLMVYVDVGEFNSVSGNQVTYTASTVSIFTFTASPSTIDYGSGSTLSWTSGGGTTASINNGVGVVGLNDSTTVYPTVTTTYTLTVSNGVGNSTTAQVTVNVSNPPPTINSFSASPLAFRRGLSTILSWQTTNATSVSISDGTTTTTGLAVDRNDYTVTPTTNTTYTLTASGYGGDLTSSVTVTVYQPGNIVLEFPGLSSPPAIIAGQSADLKWTTTGQVNVINWSPANAITSTTTSGIESVRPTTNTTYIATVSGLGASDTESITLTVIQRPVITAFSANSVAIRRGLSTRLSWSIENATNASINYGVGVVDKASGYVDVSPDTTTTYTLSVVGEGNTTATSDPVTVTVYQPGNIVLEFPGLSSPPAIIAGQETDLKWTTTGQVNVIEWSPTGAITSTTTSGIEKVRPTTNTTYIATVSGLGASDTKSITLTVIQRPVITAFSAAPAAIRRGLSTRLSWSIENATNASINYGVGVVNKVSGYVDVSPNTNTTYTLSVVGEGNTTATSDPVTVTVYQPPTVDTFTASSASIIRGNPVTLAWTTSNSTNRAITPQILNFTNIPEDGSREVFPTDTTTYRLTVTGLGSDPNISVYKEVTVIVYIPPVLTLELIPNPITAGQPATLTWSITGNADTLSWSSGGITSTTTSGIETVRPTTTTTYTATISGLGGSDTKSVTLLVYQIPTVSLSVPTSLLYGQQGTITYSSCYSNTSLVLTPTYSYSNVSGGISTVPGTAISLSRPNSAEIGVGTTCVNDQTTPTVISYNTSGPRSVSYALTAVGSGGNKTVLGSTTIVIDETPDNINIPATDDVVKSQDPVYTPKATSTITLRVVDIDIPVEIKSNKPIKVEINDSNDFRDVRLM